MSRDPVNFGLMVIGSELLLGKRRDGHFAYTVEALARLGHELGWCQYIGDHPDRITTALRRSMEDRDIVFCFGGIGATPDDHTRACAADAAEVKLIKHPEAAAIIEARFGKDAYPQRIHMAHLPEGCTLIPNPVNQIAGFSVGDHHFVPGFPQMGWPMLDWVLDHRYPHLARNERPVERLLTLPGTSEGQIIHIMQDLVARFPKVQLSCLPHMDGDYRETELGLRGRPGDVEEAASWLDATLEREGFEWTHNEPGS